MMHYLTLGGAESALLGLLQSVDPARVDVDVFIYDHRGELMRYIPTDRVRLLPEVRPYSMIERPLAECVRAGELGVAMGRMWAKVVKEKSGVPEGKDDIRIFSRVADCVVPFLPSIQPEVEYDLAISFLMPHHYVVRKVRARRKMGWIHTDYSTVFVDAARELPVWGALDYIGSISEEAGRKFCEVFPSLADKVVNVENILSSAFIRERAEEFVPTDMPRREGVVNLLSIGRFCNAKRFDEVGTLCRKVQEELTVMGAGKSVHWYIIGFGADEDIVANIEKEGVGDYVTILGKRENPYPYIKACDVYVQPSRYEGKSVTVREAQVMCKPVVVTRYPTAASQVRPGEDGVIVPIDLDGCARGIAAVVADEALQDRLCAYLAAHDYGNEGEIEKIYKIATQ